jgi:hypothetical protein
VVRRALLVFLLVLCAGVVVAFQVTRPARARGEARVFVPSPRFYTDFSPSYRTSIADAYWLYTIQYYGEHVHGDQRYDSLPALLDLITELSPGFKEAYLFGAFALIDARRPDVSYALLERGFRSNPDDWRFPAYLGFFAYTYAGGKDKDLVAAQWYAKAAALPGRPAYVPRLAATLTAKGGRRAKAMTLWAQIYATGDAYSKQKAVAALAELLPAGKQARMQAVATLEGTMSSAQFKDLVAALFKGYR